MKRVTESQARRADLHAAEVVETERLNRLSQGAPADPGFLSYYLHRAAWRSQTGADCVVVVPDPERQDA